METFRSEKNDRFYFKNYQDIDEELIIQEAKTKLEKFPHIKFYGYQEIIYLDIWEGTFHDMEFRLCNDINYGSFLICNDEHVLKEIEDILNN
ncbi:hypothetical protein [Bacillus sp. Cr_A10]|uniref:hypothetical protein n=1 Tax=Bacillus sp. Cr_A10 TaxID=3033993 RepID=UPI0023DB000D|nr:hypothetical protein [Bacillus sp. Cr_A10]MDF2068008.1 hypothetical protein [Bacillus sp. Cr_A10]